MDLLAKGGGKIRFQRDDGSIAGDFFLQALAIPVFKAQIQEEGSGVAPPPRRGQVGHPVLADWGRGQVTENEYVANGTSFGVTPIYVFFLFPIRAIIGLLLLRGKTGGRKGKVLWLCLRLETVAAPIA